ncbi:hypothetical protein Tco_1094956, partial [Tanacetum coccineum]
QQFAEIMIHALKSLQNHHPFSEEYNNNDDTEKRGEDCWRCSRSRTKHICSDDAMRLKRRVVSILEHSFETSLVQTKDLLRVWDLEVQDGDSVEATP